MTRQLHKRDSMGCRHVLIYLFLLQCSCLAKLNNVVGVPSTRHIANWNMSPTISIRSGFLSKRKRSSFLLASVGNSANDSIDTASGDEHNDHDDDDDEEWSALFPEDNQDTNQQISLVQSRASLQPTHVLATASGFRQKIELPSFRSRRNTIHSGDGSKVVPVVAVSNNKVSSLSPSPQNRQKKDQPRLESEALMKRKGVSSSAKSSSASTATLTMATPMRPLVFWENMVCGAISRSIAQTVMHPANTMKTLLQQSNAAPLVSYLRPSQFPILLRGAGANFILSVPNGAVNFAVLELVRKELGQVVRATKYLADREETLGPALDFMSSAISTICCSVVSTPQMMITDNIMAGNYKNIPDAVRGIAHQGGIKEFYARGWWPGIVGKIPSYALTWTLFQKTKAVHRKFTGREATNFENSIMGCVASGTTVCIMIPMDTIKTRLVTQGLKQGSVPYKGIVDCAVRVAREEGVKAFYKGLPPRLVSVVPMVGIQFTVYEFMKKVMQKRALAEEQRLQLQQPALVVQKTSYKKEGKIENSFDPYSSTEILEETFMEVAASQGHPYPAPHFHRKQSEKKCDARKVK